MSFWHFLWEMLVVFAFVVWVIIFFQVVFDLFRSKDVSGPGKAGWLILLIILPFLGVRLHPSDVWVPLLLVLLLLFTTGVSLFLSCANLFFRDVKYIVQVVLMFGIFFTPIFFEPTMLGPKGAYIAMLNPLTGILEGLRLSIVEGHNLLVPLTVVVKGVERVAWNPWELVYTAAFSIFAVLGSALMFRRLQHLFAEYV